MPDSDPNRTWDRAIPERAAVVLCAAALAGLIPLVFASALNDFLLSDSFRLVGQVDFATALSYFHQTAGFGRNEYRPVMLLSYAWDNLLWQERAWGYHLTNLLLHTANGVLLLLVLRRLLPNLLMAFTAAALYSVHPVHHSRVGWIAARDSEICLFFLLLAWLGFLYGRPSRAGSPPERPPRMRRSYFLAALSYAAFALALLSYEGAAAFPLVLAAADLLLGRSGAWRDRVAQTLRATSPYFVVLALYAAWWAILFHGSVGGHDLDWTLAGVGRDLYRMHYRLFANIQHWQGLLYLLAGWWAWRRRRQFGPLSVCAVAVLWLGFLPYLPVRGYADRFGFLSALGVALFLSLGMSDAARASLRRWTALLPVLLLLVVFADYTRTTQLRLQHWQEAGQMADTMLAQLKAQRPSFPPETALVFDQVPFMRGEAYVFPTGFRAALRRRYRREIPNVSYFPATLDASSQPELLKEPRALHFRFVEKETRWLELTAGLDQSSLRR